MLVKQTSRTVSHNPFLWPRVAMRDFRSLVFCSKFVGHREADVVGIGSADFGRVEALVDTEGPVLVELVSGTSLENVAVPELTLDGKVAGIAKCVLDSSHELDWVALDALPAVGPAVQAFP